MCDLKLIVTLVKDENINISYNILHDETTKYTSHVCTYHCKLQLKYQTYDTIVSQNSIDSQRFSIHFFNTIGSQQEFVNNVGDQAYLESKEVIHVYDEEYT